MRIVLITGDSSYSGAPMHVHRLALALKKKELEILIIAPPGPLCSFVHADGISCKSVKMRSFFDRRATHLIAEEVRKFAPQIVHFHGTRGGWLGRLALRKMPQIKKVYTEHLWIKEYHLTNPAYDRLQRSGLKFLERYTDKIIAVSSAVKKHLLSQGFDSKKIVVIPHGINSDFLHHKVLPKPEGVPLIIGSVGSLNKFKNHRNMILGFAHARKMRPKANLHFEIIGDGQLLKELQGLARQRNVEKYIRFNNLRSPEQIAERLEHYAVFANISLSESFGLAVGEAMAVGLPVVVSRVGGLTDLVNNQCGIFVPPRQPVKIAEALVKLIDDRKLREKLGAAGRARIQKHFKEETMVARTLVLYRELLK